MTTPGQVKKLAQTFEPPRPAPGTPPKQPSPQPLAVPGLATGGVKANRSRIEQGGNATSSHDSQRPLDAQQDLRKTVIANHLVRTGRANAPGTPSTSKNKHGLGGERSKDADDRAEQGAGRVLAGMEKATREHQAATKPGAPLTHAVSGHGKGTDQTGRLIHGRRNDELLEDQQHGRTPTTSVQLGAAPGGASTPEYTTIGSDPSNISGRFSSNLGMLHAVGEAFARADMNERSLPPGTAPERFVTGVGGRGGEHTGESFALPDAFAKQKEGDAVSPDEMRQRYAAITATPVPNSKLVLDPATGASGKRAGYTLQTAFPSAEEPDAAWNKPRHEGALADIRALAAERDEKQKELDACTKEVEKARKQVQKHQSAIAAKKTALSKTANNPTAQKKIQDAIADEQAKLTDAEKLAQEAEDAEALASMGVMIAQSELDAG